MALTVVRRLVEAHGVQVHDLINPAFDLADNKNISFEDFNDQPDLKDWPADFEVLFLEDDDQLELEDDEASEGQGEGDTVISLIIDTPRN